MEWIKSIKDTKGRLGRWVIQLQEYDYDIKHRAGVNNQAHILSRTQSRNSAADDTQAPLVNTRREDTHNIGI